MDLPSVNPQAAADFAERKEITMNSQATNGFDARRSTARRGASELLWQAMKCAVIILVALPAFASMADDGNRGKHAELRTRRGDRNWRRSRCGGGGGHLFRRPPLQQGHRLRGERRWRLVVTDVRRARS